MVIAVIGVSGSGKTTMGTMLAAEMGCPFLDGDSLHAKENTRILDCFERSQDLVVACSALKREYRRVLAEGIPITWVYLKGSPAMIRSRVNRRSNHFMKVDLLASQFDALEEPDDALIVDVAAPPNVIVEHILSQLSMPTRPDAPAASEKKS